LNLPAPLLFSLIFLTALVLSVGTRLWLAARQVRHVARHRTAVPSQFADRITLSAHQRAADYTRARVQLGMFESLLGAAVLLGLTVLGGIESIDSLVIPLILLGVALSFFAVFSFTNKEITKTEGFFLVGVYAVFIAFQAVTIFLL
jgi:hypothetical protein